MLENVLPSLVGGALIGLSAVALMALLGRIAGVSGILSGLLKPRSGDISWRALFVGGLIAGGLVMSLVHPEAFTVEIDRSLAAIAVAGLLVGFGARLGSGCVSGHGVCGVSRLSPRSLVATLTFMLSGAITVLAVRHIFGGMI